MNDIQNEQQNEETRYRTTHSGKWGRKDYHQQWPDGFSGSDE